MPTEEIKKTSRMNKRMKELTHLSQLVSQNITSIKPTTTPIIPITPMDISNRALQSLRKDLKKEIGFLATRKLLKYFEKMYSTEASTSADQPIAVARAYREFLKLPIEVLADNANDNPLRAKSPSPVLLKAKDIEKLHNLGIYNINDLLYKDFHIYEGNRLLKQINDKKLRERLSKTDERLRKIVNEEYFMRLSNLSKTTLLSLHDTLNNISRDIESGRIELARQAAIGLFNNLRVGDLIPLLYPYNEKIATASLMDLFENTKDFNHLKKILREDMIGTGAYLDLINSLKTYYDKLVRTTAQGELILSTGTMNIGGKEVNYKIIYSKDTRHPRIELYDGTTHTDTIYLDKYFIQQGLMSREGITAPRRKGIQIQPIEYSDRWR